MRDKNFPRGGPKSYPFVNFQYSTLTGLLVQAALSRRKWLSHLKWPHFGYFQIQKDDSSSAQVSFILGANCRYIFILETPCVKLEVSTSKTRAINCFPFVLYFTGNKVWDLKKQSFAVSKTYPQNISKFWCKCDKNFTGKSFKNSWLTWCSYLLKGHRIHPIQRHLT